MRWDSVHIKENIDQMVDEFMEIYVRVCEECIPHYEAEIRPDDKPYITTEIKRLIRKRDRLHMLRRRVPSDINEFQYRVCRNNVVSAIRQ